MAFNFENSGQPVTDINRPRILARPLDHLRAVNRQGL